MRGRAIMAGIVLLALTVTVGAGARLAAHERDTADPELLYLPNGKMLRVASLGHATLMADLFYLWAIQYYSNYNRADRYRYVEHVFDRVITELDPSYIDAYWLGALILILEAQDLDAGLRLLDKGARNNPDRWILPYLAGWECYHAGRRAEAQEYFRRAMQIEDAPAVLPRLIAGIESKKGDLRAAIALWQAILDDPASDPESRAIAERQLRELRTKADVRDLQTAVDRFRMENERHPVSLEELVSAAYIRFVPTDPAGRVYRYDPSEGTVSSGEGRVLGDSR